MTSPVSPSEGLEPVTPPTPHDLIPETPEGLSEAAERLWRDYHLELLADDLEPDAREAALILQAVQHLTLADRLAVELNCAELVVLGAAGQPRVNPIVGEVDKARRTVDAILKSLKPVDRSAVGAQNVSKRWSRNA